MGRVTHGRRHKVRYAPTGTTRPVGASRQGKGSTGVVRTANALEGHTERLTGPCWIPRSLQKLCRSVCHRRNSLIPCREQFFTGRSLLYSLKESPLAKEHVGGKAHHLMQLSTMGVEIPHGFVLPTDWQQQFKPTVRELKLSSAVRVLAENTNKTWTSPHGTPLVVSVRSGAPVSMPGMMETILNVGLTRDNLGRFAESKQCNGAFANDCYRRLIQMYATTVMGMDKGVFTQYYDAAKVFWLSVNEDAAKKLVELYEKAFKKEAGYDFPDSPNHVLINSVNAVFESWNSDKAKQYRELEGIDDNMGTAIVVQEMVFGNTSELSGTGVVFTHNPNTGVRGLYGDFLTSAQGEDVVAGTHKTLPVEELLKNPDLRLAGKRLQGILTQLFAHYKEMVDVEFTIENQKLWILQARMAKHSRRASVRLCLDMVKEGQLNSDDATERIMGLIPVQQGATSPKELECIGKGVGVTEGEVVGRLAIGKGSVEEFMKTNEPFIYAAKETAPDDSFQMKHAVGILTAQGGALSHAAVVARSWNKCCVVGFEEMKVNTDNILVEGIQANIGDWVKINGTTGEVYL